MPRTPSAHTAASPAHRAGPSGVLAPLRDQAMREIPRLRQQGHWCAARVEAPLAPIDPLAWLARQQPNSRFFWRSREAEAAWAGSGLADVCTGNGALARLVARWPRLPAGAHYFGGMRFAPAGRTDPRWRSFGDARFVLPRFELQTSPAATRLVMNITSEDDEAAISAALQALSLQAEPINSILPLPHDREDAPDSAGWRAAVGSALRRIEHGELEKVVLARRATFSFEEYLDPFGLAAALFDATPSCYHFLFETDTGATFVGATPERLFRQRGRRIETEALAGTRQRGSNPAADRALRNDLVSSDKDVREHGVVLRSITDALAPLASDLAVGETAPLALSSKWHLCCSVEGTLREGAAVEELVAALHPTPAVNGAPAAVAGTCIARLEPFDRGWYAGPIGRWGRDETDVAVAIRSGLIRSSGAGATLDLYSGAGIVAGSDADAEWAEVESKLFDFNRVLGLDS